MGFQLQPQEYFTIVRHLPDPADLSTSYVQAVIRDSRTSQILDTVVLAETGTNTHRFTKVWQVPADVSGLGFYIDVTTYVYTDPTYTTKSTTYGEDNNTYQVFDRFKHIGGGSSGADVDYKKISKLLQAAIKPLTDKEVPEVSLTPVLDAISALDAHVKTIEMPEMEKVELMPVLSAIANAKTEVLAAIDQKEVTESPDLTPVLDAISGAQDTLMQDAHDHRDQAAAFLTEFKGIVDAFKTKFDTDYPKIGEALDTLVGKMQKAFVYTGSLTKEKPDLASRARGLLTTTP